MRVMTSRQDQIASGIREIEQNRRSRMRSSELHVDSPSAGVDLGVAKWGRAFPPAPATGGRYQPGRERISEVNLVAADERVFGRSLSGLGNACTGSAAQVSAALIGSGNAVATGFMDGRLGTRVQSDATSNLNAVLDPAAKAEMLRQQSAGTAGLGIATDTTATASGGMTKAQTWGAVFSVLTTATAASWNAACQARQGVDTVGNSFNLGREVTDQTVTLVHNAQQAGGTAPTNVPAAGATPTTTPAPEPAPAPSTANDDKKMLYIGGGIAVVAVVGLILMK